MLDTMRSYFNWKVILSAILLALVLFVIFMLLLIGSKPEQQAGGSVTAIVNIVPAATFTPALALPTHTPAVTDTPVSASSSGMIVLDSYVQVTGTGGSGLRLRVEASLDGEVRLLGGEDEIFMVKDGPLESGGYTWWYLVSPSDESRRGWAVQDFLTLVQNP